MWGHLVLAIMVVLCLVGARDSIVGRSHECDYPADRLQHVPVLTSQKTVFTTPADVDRQVIVKWGRRLSLSLSLVRSPPWAPTHPPIWTAPQRIGSASPKHRRFSL